MKKKKQATLSSRKLKVRDVVDNVRKLAELDGVGEWTCTSIGFGKDNKIEMGIKGKIYMKIKKE